MSQRVVENLRVTRNRADGIALRPRNIVQQCEEMEIYNTVSCVTLLDQ